MNTNKKHKSKNKPNKPPNTGQPEQSEITVESEKEKIISENVERVNVEEVKVVEEIKVEGANTEKDFEPKKPKRNKNKKKKTTDDEVTKQDLDIKVTASPEPPKESYKCVDTQEKTAADPIIAPTARKKNKNKQHEVIQPADTVKTEISTRKEEQMDTEPVFLPANIDDDKNEQETKVGKKKNKKKKRHDSERSEKAEEMISCTAAFQMLLDAKTDKKDNFKGEATTSTKPEQKQIEMPVDPVSKDNKPEDGSSKKKNKKGKNKEDFQTKDIVTEKKDNQTSKKDDEVTSCTSPSEMLFDVKTDSKDNTNKGEAILASALESKLKHMEIPKEPVSKDMKIEDTPSKKKNKKGKNKEEFQSIGTETDKILSFTQEEQVQPKIQEIETKREIEPLETEIKEKELEVITKTKAKIAKPVEIKHKPKAEEKETESPACVASKDASKETESKPVSLGDILFEESKKNTVTEHKQQMKDNEKKDSKTIDQPGKLEEFKVDSQVVDETKKVESKTGSKSHSKQKHHAPEKVEIITIPVETKSTEPLVDLPSDDENFVIPSLLDISEDEPKVVDEKLTVSQKPVLDKLETKDIGSTDKDARVETIFCQTEKPDSADELQVPSHKRNKRKKSPKPSVKSDTMIAIQDVHQPQSEHEHKKTVTDLKTKRESDSAIVPQRDVTSTEKLNKPTEEETTQKQLEVTPDLVQYPRSMSHQTSDSNNNTFIQEIRTLDPVKLDIPIVTPDSPLIKGSGETPDNPSEIKVTGVTVTELKLMPTSELPKEKTDLKSKVMEVNQDMEELRLSIERSLAELTFLENKENEKEKQYREKDITSEFEAEASKVSLKPVEEIKEPKIESDLQAFAESPISPPPRQDNKAKGKSKKKNKHETQQVSQVATTTPTQGTAAQASCQTTEPKDNKQDKNDGKSEQKSESATEKSKQSDSTETQNASNEPSKTDGSKLYSITNQDKNINEKTKNKETNPTDVIPGDFEPIEKFEDAMTSSLEDVNKSFEIIASNSTTNEDSNANPQISITAPEEDTVKKDVKGKINPVSQPKNLLGHPDIPVPSNRTDYKKEKNRPPNTRQAKVKIKDAVDIEPKSKESKESQTESKGKFSKKDTTVEESVTCVTNENEEYVYKYSFRKVFLPNICHVCKKELKTTKVPCNYCSLIFYCSSKHKDEGWPQHQNLCFAVSTVAHHKNQKHIYADSKGLSSQAYRVFRMQLIVACEKVLKRRLVPWEQEAILYPRICAEVTCREYRQTKLKDCEGCGQISYCSEDHYPKSHQKWCKSYSLYQKLVYHQQTQGRLAPKLPTRVLTQETQIPDKINMVLANLYEEQIDMNDIQYAALTQIATAPLTTAYSYQLYRKSMEMARFDKETFTIHIINAELQYEADALNKWESLFLHLHPLVEDLRVVLTGTELNPGRLPLDLLGKVKLCANCRLHGRRLTFSFQDSRSYAEYWDSNEFITPDIVCAFNPSIQRATIYNGKDQWPLTINTIFKLKAPFLITSYTMNELNRDLNRVKECSKIDFKVVSKANFNPFASVRPDRNFITDDEIPLLFKNYCFSVLCGV